MRPDAPATGMTRSAARAALTDAEHDAVARLNGAIYEVRDELDALEKSQEEGTGDGGGGGRE